MLFSQVRNRPRQAGTAGAEAEAWQGSSQVHLLVFVSIHDSFHPSGEFGLS